MSAHAAQALEALAYTIFLAPREVGFSLPGRAFGAPRLLSALSKGGGKVAIGYAVAAGVALGFAGAFPLAASSAASRDTPRIGAYPLRCEVVHPRIEGRKVETQRITLPDRTEAGR